MINHLLLNGDCLQKLKEIESDSVDSLVTDPPAGIAFMGKAWDSDKGGRDQWIAWLASIMRECHRVMKPGAYGLVWALPKTSHWTATALEDAGFDIRDRVAHLFGSGFPKSQNISIAIDKQAGAKREVVGVNPNHRSNNGEVHSTGTMCGEPHTGNGSITAPATDAAKEWNGWGTALKPACEDWWLVQKPISEKTIAKNVLKWGVGGLNIDASRISCDTLPKSTSNPNIHGKFNTAGYEGRNTEQYHANVAGRFPSHLLLSCADTCTEDAHDMFECPIALLDEQSGVLKTNPGTYRSNKQKAGRVILEKENKKGYVTSLGDSGGASRFFYCAKASKSDKSVGNTHPTVKSTKLMSYLIRMITPPNGTVLDCFMGSGSTGVAAISEGFKFLGIEKELEYFQIAKSRIEADL